MGRRLCEIVLWTILGAVVVVTSGCAVSEYLYGKPKPKVSEKKSNFWSDISMALIIDKYNGPEASKRYLRRKDAVENGEITPEEQIGRAHV